ncbi:MAG: hypothetical protein DIU69_10460 [Bacillota bacterium]|nr:MAG: hypothetical protein DIU69_10460 [Bacillota bacterium]
MYRGASGKLLLAYLREDQREAILEQVPLDAASRDRLRAELVAIRQAGYATSFGERQPEIASLAVPVRRRSGTIAAALAVSGPESRLRPERMQALLPTVRSTAEGLGRLLP